MGSGIDPGPTGGETLEELVLQLETYSLNAAEYPDLASEAAQTRADIVRGVTRLRVAVERLTAERDEAVEWLGVVRDELVIAGYPGGDRTVALANIRALIARAARLEEALRGDGTGPRFVRLERRGS